MAAFKAAGGKIVDTPPAGMRIDLGVVQKGRRYYTLTLQNIEELPKGTQVVDVKSGTPYIVGFDDEAIRRLTIGYKRNERTAVGMKLKPIRKLLR